jgi:hypothetical protein
VTTRKRVSRQQARELLNFAGRPDAAAVSRQLVEEQLDGAVAAHNLLQTRGLAYIADEVGTGKTLVAAGVLALLRHDEPDLRALVLTPRANLQDKWRRELRSFARHDVRFSDLRVRGLDAEPVRPPRVVPRLADLLTAWEEEPGCDVISRLSSFELAHRRRTVEEREAYLESWRRRLAAPGSKAVKRLLGAAARAGNPLGVKETIAACANRLLPEIGVLVVDEAHNLKGGTDEQGAARNRVLWTLLGHNDAYVDRVPGYGPRVERVLMLSATPMEDDIGQLLRQLQVLGIADRVPGLAAEDEEERLAALHTFLFRRLTKLQVGGQELTRNRYRQEWRAGGTDDPASPLLLEDDRTRLTFAVVQKKVADALNAAGSGRRFQIGMLTSFESLAESTRRALGPQLAPDGDGSGSNPVFDDAAQNSQAGEDERRGLDADGIGELVKSHRATFGRSPTHPKMDAVVDRLVDGARHGRKALVFTRRVASVDELVQRVNDRLDRALEDRLRAELPGLGQLESLLDGYRRYREEATARSAESCVAAANFTLAQGDSDLADDEAAEGEEGPGAMMPSDAEVTEAVRGGTSLFAWLFRERSTEGLLTGWWLRQRLERESGGYVTLLRDNHVAAVLGCDPGQVPERLRAAVPDVAEPLALVDEVAQDHLGAASQPATLTRFRAAQLAGLQVLDQHGSGHEQRMAALALSVLAPAAPTRRRDREVPVSDRLSELTLATAIRADPELCDALWHSELAWSWSTEDDFLRREWRWRLLAAAVRLDQPAIDLWLCEVRRRGSLTASERQLDAVALAHDFLITLRRQRDEPGERWSSYGALAALADDADLVLEINGVQLGTDAIPTWVGNRVPAVGMSGQVNATAIRQFRTPTYPLVLVSTDLLQDGEDLHTFCDEVHHYGIAWMPSALEQRTGRVDRVNSLVERRFSRAGARLGEDGRPPESERLQVLYPHVSQTYEQLQVRRVLDRLDEHVRLLHESFGEQVKVSPRIDVDREIADDTAMPEPATNLGEPYRVDPDWLTAPSRSYPVIDAGVADRARDMFASLLTQRTWGRYPVSWWTRTPDTHLLGQCRLDRRVQPIDLRLTSLHGRPAMHVVSPVGLLSSEQLQQLVTSRSPVNRARLGIVRLGPRERRTFSLTVEDLVLLPDGELGQALERRVVTVLEQADRMEADLLDVDLPLDHFADDLRQEARGG